MNCTDHDQSGADRLAFLFWLAGDAAETVEDLEERRAADDDLLQPVEDWSDLYD